MAVCALSKALRRLNLLKKENIPLYYSTHQTTELPVKINPVLLQIERPLPTLFENHVKFAARSVNLNVEIPRTGIPISKIIEFPMLPNFEINEPLKNKIEKSDIITNKVIEIPQTFNIIEKQAVRMIIIRRKKMKKHKRRKFLKRMKFIIRKTELNRRILKKKMFEAEMRAILQEAEKFDAKKYVAERIEVLTKERLPNRWRGEVLPEAMIRQFIKEKKEKSAYKHRLRTYRLTLD